MLVLLGFGALLLAPRLADRLEAWLSPLIRYGPRTRGDGFLSGLGVGAALGFVYAPCAGPILAAVISVERGLGVDGRGGAQLRGRLGGRPARALPRRPARAAAASAGRSSSA